MINQPKHHSARSCACAQCELRAENETRIELTSIAQHELDRIRQALELLYSDGLAVGGDVRYHLLWRLSELDRIAASLQRLVSQIDTRTEIGALKKQIESMFPRARELEQEARLLIDAWSRPRGRLSKITRRSTGASSRRMSAAYF